MPVDTDAIARLAFTVGPSGRTLVRDGEPFVLHADTGTYPLSTVAAA